MRFERGLRAALACVAALAASDACARGSWPSHQVNIVVGFTAGGSTDIVARLVADELRRAWGQPVVVENRPGAGGNIGAAAVARAKPDGYTLLMGSVGPLAINASLYAGMPYDNLRDFTPITLVVHVPTLLVVNPQVMPANSLAEFVALLKANPGKYFFASTGTGTSSHLAGELLKLMAGVEATHVPYKGAAALTDLLAGEQVHFMFSTIPAVIPHLRSGRLRALAVSTLARSAAALSEQGADPVANTPEEFAEYIRAETAKWAKIVKASGATPD